MWSSNNNNYNEIICFSILYIKSILVKMWYFLPFCLIFLHMVGRMPGRCSNSLSCLQSLIGTVLLSKGSAHFGSVSDLQSQHFIPKAIIIIKKKKTS